MGKNNLKLGLSSFAMLLVIIIGTIFVVATIQHEDDMQQAELNVRVGGADDSYNRGYDDGYGDGLAECQEFDYRRCESCEVSHHDFCDTMVLCNDGQNAYSCPYIEDLKLFLDDCQQDLIKLEKYAILNQTCDRISCEVDV